MNDKFKDFPSMWRCTGLRSRLSYFSITEVELPVLGTRVTGELEGQFKTVSFDVRGW
jgi:hypothetical protein